MSAHYDVPQILEELERRRELPDEEVAELIRLGVLDTHASEQRDGPGTGSHALGILLGASATALLVHAMTSLPRGVKP